MILFWELSMFGFMDDGDPKQNIPADGTNEQQMRQTEQQCKQKRQRQTNKNVPLHPKLKHKTQTSTNNEELGEVRHLKGHLTSTTLKLGGRLMCSNKCVQAGGHYSVLEPSEQSPGPKSKNDEASSEKMHCWKVLQLYHALWNAANAGKVQN